MIELVTRRDFLLGAAAGAAAANITSGSAVAAADSATKGSPRNFELGCVTSDLGRDWDFEDVLLNCERMRLMAVELVAGHRHGVDPANTLDKRRQIYERATNKTWVKLYGLGTFCEFSSPDAAVVEENIRQAGEFLELCHQINAVGVNVRPGNLPEKADEKATLQQIGHALAECAGLAERHGAELWLEMHGRGTATPAAIKQILDACGHPAVGVTWNCNSTDLADGTLAQSFAPLASRLRCVHIHELWTAYPYAELFRLLRQHKYDRYTLAEIPATADPDRLMHYYRKLWETLSA